MDWSFLINDKSSLNVTTDSRKITPGCVFVALKGENFDGNKFALQALEQGASLAIVDDEQVYNAIQEAGEYSALLVENSLLALQDLAREWRRYLGTRIIGITGTNGKTTTKELLAAVLNTRYKTHYTQGNLNNSIGVPLTLLQLTKEHELAIVEMGASHPGDIKELVEVAEPNFGLITNVGKAHLLGFGSFEGVMQTKAELYDYLIKDGYMIFLNKDNPHLKQMLFSRLPAEAPQHKETFNKLYETVRVGEPDADNVVNIFCYSLPSPVPVSQTHLVGDYNAENIAAAMAVGMYFGCRLPDCEQAICNYIPTNNRSQKTVTEKNTLIVDAYNANPTSMTASINAFSGDTYILGAMRELGEYSHTEHQNIVNMLLERKADQVLLVGDEYRETTAPYPIYSNVDELCEHLKQQPVSGCTILIKGSRSNQLEKVIPLL